MKTTIYELLGMIKDGKAPKKIKYEGVEYYLYDDTAYLKTDKSRFLDTIRFDMLNDEVEILEEDEKIEKIYHCITGLTQNEVEIFITKNLNLMVDKINEIIDEVNKLKEK